MTNQALELQFNCSQLLFSILTGGKTGLEVVLGRMKLKSVCLYFIAANGQDVPDRLLAFEGIADGIIILPKPQSKERINGRHGERRLTKSG